MGTKTKKVSSTRRKRKHTNVSGVHAVLRQAKEALWKTRIASNPKGSFTVGELANAEGFSDRYCNRLVRELTQAGTLKRIRVWRMRNQGLYLDFGYILTKDMPKNYKEKQG